MPSASTSSAMAARPASATRARSPTPIVGARSTPMTWSRCRCCRATATSKAACRPMCAPTISPRRRSSSPMPLPATIAHRPGHRIRWRRPPTASDVYLSDIWPTNKEVADLMLSSVTAGRCSATRYANVFDGDKRTGRRSAFRAAPPTSWNPVSTYVQNPPYFEGMTMTPHRASAIFAAPAHSGDLRRFDHHRSHLARRQHQGGLARRHLPRRAPGRDRRLQQLRRAPRQP